MRRVTGTRDRIVPRVQMAPGINHPRRARAARARATAQGLLPAPPARCGCPHFEHPPRASRPGRWGGLRPGGEAALCIATGAQNEALSFGRGV